MWSEPQFYQRDTESIGQAIGMCSYDREKQAVVTGLSLLSGVRNFTSPRRGDVGRGSGRVGQPVVLKIETLDDPDFLSGHAGPTLSDGE